VNQNHLQRRVLSDRLQNGSFHPANARHARSFFQEFCQQCQAIPACPHSPCSPHIEDGAGPNGTRPLAEAQGSEGKARQHREGEMVDVLKPFMVPMMTQISLNGSVGSFNGARTGPYFEMLPGSLSDNLLLGCVQNGKYGHLRDTMYENSQIILVPYCLCRPRTSAKLYRDNVNLRDDFATGYGPELS